MASVQLGQRVVRGPKWAWRDQDGGPGHVGTVIRLETNELPGGVGTPHGWAKIRWDNGYSNNYQVGAKDAYDLILLDNAPAGVKHAGIKCDSCGEEPITGMRWKCSESSCPDFDLCTPCYMEDKHIINHQFIRFITPQQTGSYIAGRFGEVKTAAKGLFPGATVKRGKDWQGGDGEGVSGKILGLTSLDDRARAAALVHWDSTGTATVHRVGCGGKVELEYEEPGSGIEYYHNHLPLLGKEEGLQTGDYVAVTLDEEMVETIQRTSGRPWTPAMGKVYAKVGKVVEVTTDGDARVSYPSNESFTFHPQVLHKVVKFRRGDRVRVVSELALVKSLQDKSQNRWIDGMELCLGMIGNVLNVDSALNCRVNLPIVSTALSWHPCALTLVKRAHADSGILDTEPDGDAESILKALMSLLKTGTDPSGDDAAGEDEGKQLVQAAKMGRVEKVVEILSKSPDEVNIKVEGKSALHKAAFQGHLEVVQALVENRADLEIRDGSGNTPLHYAVEGDEPAIIKYLLSKGADVNRGTESGRRPLHTAAWKGLVDCTRVLLKHKCDVNLQDSDKDTALHDAIYKKNLEVIDLLVQAPDLDLSIKNKRELTPLQFTAFLDRPQAAELIVQSHPRSIIIPREDGNTVAHIAAVNNNVAVLKVLLAVEDSGLNIDAKNDIGMTPLHLAATKGQTDCIELLVTQGADINSPGTDDNSALCLLAMVSAKSAGKVKDSPTLEKIKQKYPSSGVDDNAAALMVYMVLRGAVIDAENQQCRTPLSFINNAKLKKTLKGIAREEKNDDMASWEDLGEDEDVKAGCPSHYASFENSNDVINNLRSKRDSESEEVDVPPSPAGADPPGASPKIDTSRTEECKQSTGTSKAEVFDLVHKIDIADLKMGAVIGKGQFGIVYRATWRGTPVAVKRIMSHGFKRAEVEKEVSIHRRATHPNIVQMMALGYDDTDAYIVMQLIEGRSLGDIIFPDRPDPNKVTLDRSQKLRIAREVMQAVTFMHACKILHLDIKPANILIETSTTKPYLCDLGLAHIKSMSLLTLSTMNIRGTPCFMPPEALGPMAASTRHSDKHDVWSVAGTLVELFAGKRLWGDTGMLNPLAFLAQMLTGIVRKPPTLAALEPQVRSILEPCFNKEPTKRPSAQELLDKFTALS